MSEMSQMTNKQNFRKSRTLTLEQLDNCLSNGEVQTRFSRYIKHGKSRHEGPMSETEALEEALMDVFCGAKNRGFRLYRQYATEAHVKRLKRILADTVKGAVVDAYVPDMVGLREMLRKTDEISALSRLLVAEQSGRNDENEVRERAVELIVAKINDVQKSAKASKDRSGPTAEELAEVSSAS